MRLKRLLVFALAISFLLAGDRANAEEEESLAGIWLPATAELGGNPFPEELRKAVKLVIERDKYTVTVGNSIDQGTVKLDPKATPKQLDITGTDGPNKAKTLLGIYEHDGDTLRVCYDLSGKSRPTEFKTALGTQLYRVTYKRVKP